MKNGVAFALGALSGGIIATIITTIVVRSSMEKEHEERTNSIIKAFSDDKKALEAKYAKKEVPAVVQTDNVTITPTPVPVPAPVIDDIDREPEVISSDEYGKTGNRTSEVNIYTDGVIEVGDDRITISEVYDILGKDNFKELSLSDSSVIYIRNFMDSTDYRVEQLNYEYFGDDMDESG